VFLILLEMSYAHELMLMKENLNSHKKTSVSVRPKGGVPKGTGLEIGESVVLLVP
jgi:anti-sigma-K factor RskA